MNVQELYNHITSHLTPEQALMKLLEGHVMTYEKLKFQEGEEIHPLLLITMAAVDMGWNMAIPNTGNDEDEVQGIICGTEEYMKTMLKDE